jgi:heat shock protein HtpX
MLANVAKWGAIFGGFGGRDDRDNNIFALLAMAIVAPIAAMIMNMAISRQNEFVADRTGAEITGRPLALASALKRLDAYAHRIPMQVNAAAAQLAIVNPLSGAQGMGMLKLFSTHPPTAERVAKLEAMTGQLEIAR